MLISGLDIDDRVGLDADDRQALAGELARLGSLHALLQWALRREPPLELTGVTVQDEFTHDVVMRRFDGIYLVFDTT